MYSPLVSIIVPNYNHSKFLECRLESIFNQTYKKFEVIILDDKSTDNSLEIIYKYKNNPHLSKIVINEHNSGSPFKQWDKGIQLAKGELIWIAETDDYNDLDFLRCLISEWSHHRNTVIAFSNYIQFNDNGIISIPKSQKNRCFEGMQYIKKRQVRCNMPINASGVLFSKNVYYKISKEFTEFKSAGDYMFWTSIMLHGKVVRVRKNLTFYRLHNGSVTSNNVSRGVTCIEDLKIQRFIENHVRLSKYDKYMAKAVHYKKYNNIQYDSEVIQKDILDKWNISEHNNKFRLANMLLYLSIRVENYLGILI